MKTVIHAEIWLDVVIPWPKYWNQPRRHRSTASEYYVSLFIIGLLHGKSDTGPLICDSLMIRNTEELRARLCPDYVPVAPSRILPGALIDPGPRGCRPLWPNPLTTPSSFLFRYMLYHTTEHTVPCMWYGKSLLLYTARARQNQTIQSETQSPKHRDCNHVIKIALRQIKYHVSINTHTFMTLCTPFLKGHLHTTESTISNDHRKLLR